MKNTLVAIAGLGIAGVVAYNLMKPKTEEKKFPTTIDIISDPFGSGAKLLETFADNISKIKQQSQEQELREFYENFYTEEQKKFIIPKEEDIPATTPEVIDFIDKAINKPVEVEVKPATEVKIEPVPASVVRRTSSVRIIEPTPAPAPEPAPAKVLDYPVPSKAQIEALPKADLGFTPVVTQTPAFTPISSTILSSLRW